MTTPSCGFVAEMQKVIPVAGQEYATSLMGKPENCLVGKIARKGLAQ
jgi:hypothetical protein